IARLFYLANRHPRSPLETRARRSRLALAVRDPFCDRENARLSRAVVAPRPTPPLAAAVDAVRLFLGELDLPRDQAAIVEFNAGADLLQPLTGRGSDLVEALRRIRVAPTTRIDLGIQVAREELGSARRGVGNMPVMIVLTDGRANPVGPAAAVREAAAARDAGVTVFTIGLGEDLDLDALRQMASKPEYFYRAPDGEDLMAIYKAIAVAIPCPREHYWGRR
ncbi:MAG: VWA domain-containing protein, partial [bacterium]